MNSKEQVSSWRDLLLQREVWFPFLLCTLNLVGQQAGGMKIIQGFQVEIFSTVYAGDGFEEAGGYHHEKAFDYWASVILSIIRLFAALLAANCIKYFG